MKKIIFLFFLLYGLNSFSQDLKGLCGVYKYTHSDKSQSSLENQYIVLEKNVDGKIHGRFYATTDEFIDAREGYYPGYFVTPMDSLLLIHDSIIFTINVSSKDLFKKPIPLKIKTAKDAHNLKFPLWKSGWIGDILHRKYVGYLENNMISFYNTYLKKKLKFLKYNTTRHKSSKINRQF